MLSIGTMAPEFSLPDQNGEIKSLSDFFNKENENPSLNINSNLLFHSWFRV